MTNKEFEKELKRFIELHNRSELKGLSDQDLFASIVLEWSLSGIGTTYRSFEEFGWSRYKIAKIAKNEKCIHTEPLYSENTGLLSGKGYVVDDNIIEMLNTHAL